MHLTIMQRGCETSAQTKKLAYENVLHRPTQHLRRPDKSRAECATGVQAPAFHSGGSCGAIVSS